MPSRSNRQRAAWRAAAAGSLDIREAFRGSVDGASRVVTLDRESASSNPKRVRVASPLVASPGQSDIRVALLRGSLQYVHSTLTPDSLSLDQEDALLTWGAQAFDATWQAWEVMDDAAPPLLLVANLQLIPPKVAQAFSLLQDLDSKTVTSTRTFLAVASTWWRLQKAALHAASDRHADGDPPL